MGTKGMKKVYVRDKEEGILIIFHWIVSLRVFLSIQFKKIESVTTYLGQHWTHQLIAATTKRLWVEGPKLK